MCRQLASQGRVNPNGSMSGLRFLFFISSLTFFTVFNFYFISTVSRNLNFLIALKSSFLNPGNGNIAMSILFLLIITNSAYKQCINFLSIQWFGQDLQVNLPPNATETFL